MIKWIKAWWNRKRDLEARIEAAELDRNVYRVELGKATRRAEIEEGKNLPMIDAPPLVCPCLWPRWHPISRTPQAKRGRGKYVGRVAVPGQVDHGRVFF